MVDSQSDKQDSPLARVGQQRELCLVGLGEVCLLFLRLLRPCTVQQHAAASRRSIDRPNVRFSATQRAAWWRSD